MVNFGEFVIGIVLAGLFLFALIGFGTQMAIDNPTNISIRDNNIIDAAYTDVDAALDQVKLDTDKNKESFFSNLPLVNVFGIVLDSIVGIGSLMVNGFMQSIFQVIANFFSQILGLNDTVVFGVLMAFFSITGILLAWRVYRAGN
jgi:ABC-type bacteriocin/lantibiotic exporter with double-glycine peptidase domain